MRIFAGVFFAVFAAAVSFNAGAAVRMPHIFQSNMVLQRDKEITIWGFGDAGEKVTVIFRDITRETFTGQDRRWMIRFPAQAAGGPYEMLIRGDSGVIELKNILLGDVWLCGGQSNMQFTINDIGHVLQDTASLELSDIRLFTAPIGMDYTPREDLAGGRWVQATPATVRNFSATAWFFGKFLYDTLKVPVGLISDNLGATALETWMSPQVLAQFPQFGPYCKEYLEPGLSVKEIDSAFGAIRAEWEEQYYLTGKGISEKWYLPETDISGWKTMEIPAWWEENGLPGFDGAVWFRRSFDLPAGFSGDTLALMLNQIDDYDMVWVNGKKVGEGFGNRNWRNYKVPGDILKKKENTLVVRVFDKGGRGGMYTHAIWGNEILLGKWYYKADIAIDAGTFAAPKVANVSPFSTPAVLYNANIAPITLLSLKGFIWYQGESNVSRACEYRELFPAFIRDWRSRFGQEDLAFLFVQLANFMQEVPGPSESNWAELREAQAAALELPGTGMAVTIDIGDAYDIHPKNKRDVGRRLGLAALNVAYGLELVSTGPEFGSAAVDGRRIILNFKKGSGPPVVKDPSGNIRGFAIAGSNRKFRWAEAFIEGDQVIVSSEKVKKPVAVRYAWSDNPGPVNLYNSSGLPAAPFRTDDWPLSTEGKVFSENPWENE